VTIAWTVLYDGAGQPREAATLGEAHVRFGVAAHRDTESDNEQNP
jgi:hypothetical protein